jgi:hypothetical protein
VSWSEWFPWQGLIDWSRESGLDNRDFDDVLVEARDKLDGRHDFEWWDLKLIRFLAVAIERKRAPKSGARGNVGGSDLFDRAKRLREAENAGGAQ